MLEPRERLGAAGVGKSRRQAVFGALAAGGGPGHTGFRSLGGSQALDTQKLSPTGTEVVGKRQTWMFKCKT